MNSRRQNSSDVNKGAGKTRPSPAPPTRRKDDGGFTLIEVVIVLVILVFISLGIYQMTTETYRLRDSLATEGEFYNAIRMSMDVVQRDVAAIYSPIISRPTPATSPSPNPQNPYSQPLANTAEMQALATSDQGRTSAFWLAATDKTGLRASRFVGTDTKMTFISASHVRIYKDKPESDFVQVTYEAVRDPNQDLAGIQDAQALLRIANPAAFDDDERRAERTESRYFLLHGIRKFRLRYWRKLPNDANGKWEPSWDTDKEDYKEKYPDKIELTLEIAGPDRLSFTGTYIFKPEVPLSGLNPKF